MYSYQSAKQNSVNEKAKIYLNLGWLRYITIACVRKKTTHSFEQYLHPAKHYSISLDVYD